MLVSTENNRDSLLWWARLRVLCGLVVLLFVVLFSVPSFGAENEVAEQTAQRLAERVAAIPGLRGPVRLDWHADARWSEGESNFWKDLIRGELQDHSLELTEDASTLVLAVHAEETPTQVVLTASVRIGDRPEVRVVSVQRTLLPPTTVPVAPIRLDRQMIFESMDRILDATSQWNGEEGGLALLLYKNFELVAVRVNAKGEVKQTLPLSAANLPPTRDPRGEMTPKGAAMLLQLHGKSCDFAWDASSETHCRAQKPLPPGKSEWRGETILNSPCDSSDWRVAVSGQPSENGAGILAIVPEGALRESSAAVLSEFPGPIIGVNGEQNLNSALVVIRNLRTGNYEIYKITLACGD